MNRVTHSLLLLVVIPLYFLVSISRVEAQCGYDSRGNVVFYIPPAFAAQNGDPEFFTSAKMYVGYRDGSIQAWEFDALNQSANLIQTYTPGEQIPAEVDAIMYLSIPSPGRVVGLVIYDDGGTSRYGILRSTDGGGSWSLLKPPAVTALEVIEYTENRLHGNYWRGPLLEMKWLEDGMHGWLWGRRSALKTTDGGATWTEIYSATAKTSPASLTVSDTAYHAIWGVAFNSPESGVVIEGNKIATVIWYTTDGGDNWNFGSTMSPKLIVDVDWTGAAYRLLRADPFNFGGNNLEVLNNSNGQGSWQPYPKKPPIETNAELMTELLWPAHNVGFLVHRQGEIWRTDDGGKTWNSVQAIDNTYPPVPFGDGFGTDRGPQQGYGQKSIFIKDEDGQNYIVHVLTDTCTGELRDKLIYVWPIDQFAGVDETREQHSAMNVQTSPNPASSSLDLSFTLQKRGTVLASLVNAQGVRVKNVKLGLLEAGQQTQSISVEGVPGGYYQLEVIAGEEREAQSVIIVR